MLKPSYKITPLPPSVDLDTVPILKALASANRALAELKGRAATIPNQTILIDTLVNQTGFTGEHKAWKVSHDQRKFREPFFNRSARARSAFGA
uniref:Fic/DOC family N-terminal domain-containing protein n=2 Tax=Yoonia sp. TaxID=2212373 RepID=UPI004048DD53